MVSHFFCSIILSKKSKMTISIELDDRQYRDIELYCNMNNIKINDYLTDIITEKHMLNKYGDLNEIMSVTIEEDKTKIKKRGRPKKDVETQSEIEAVIEEKKEDTNEEKENKMVEMTENREVETVIKPTVKRKRTLKTI